MGRILAEKPGDTTTPRHPSSRAPVPGPAIYLDAKDKDLPYDGCFKRAHRGPETSYFDQPLGIREEGAMLLAILTGVQGSPLQKLAPGMPGFSLLYGVGREDAKESPGHIKGTTPRAQGLKLDLGVDAAVGLSANAAMRKHHQKFQKNVQPVDECVDTTDLEELTAEKDPSASKNWLFATVEEEELYKFSQDLEAKAGAGRELNLKDYIALVKKSAGRLGVRTQMLQDLCLAEDVDLGVTDLPAAPPPPPPPKPGANPDKPDHEDPAKPKPGKDPYVGAMCATSLVVKKARRLAGMMHTEQQTMDLRDVWDWLQHLGTIAPPENRSVDATKADGVAGGKGKPEDQKQGDWRLPSSPAMALLYAQEDLRQRLAHLYQEKNTLEARKLQLTAAKRLVGKVGDAEEFKLQNYIHGLQTLEEGYETLGGKIADNLDDAQNLDKRFQTLTEEARGAEKEKDGKGDKKGKKKRRKGKKGKKGQKREKSGDDEEKGDASGASDGDAEGEGSDGEGKSKEKKRGMKKDSPTAEVLALGTEHKATSPIVSSPRELDGRASTMDQACQTDDAALFSLMEKMFNDMEDDGPIGPEDEATELRRLRREAKKLRVQLRFWRSRNWVEQHQHLLSSATSPLALPVDASPSEAGFAFYFDNPTPTSPGLNGARGGPGSAPSNLTGHGIGQPAGGGGAPSSAPSNLSSTRPAHPTPSPAPSVEHQARASVPPPLPAGLRLSQAESQRPSNPLNLRLMANSPPRGSRAARGWSVRPHDPPPAFPPNSLVIFGRSSQLLTPRESTPHAHAMPQIGNITPRRSGMQHQKA